MARILVIGAGICGLGTALLLARDGNDVTVLERDAEDAPDSAPASWDAWRRKGVAQFRQPHNFMPGLRALLEAELPDVQDRLRAAGAARFDLLAAVPPSLTDHAPRPIDDKLWTYTARRPTGEWVFLEAAAREPRVVMRRGVEVAELLTGSSAHSGIPHIAGVKTRDGESLYGELVVDASGRASRATKWLAAIGSRAPHEEAEDCGFTYYTRFFRGTQPAFRMGALTSLGTISLLTLPGDNGTWSVTIFAASDDKALRRLRDPDIWMRVVRAYPLHSHWLDGELISAVLVMGGVVDRYRRFVVEGHPVATGFVAIADAWACTNPSAGRGLTVGMLHGRALRNVLRESAGDAYALARRFDAATEQEVTPWYRAQIALDRARFSQMRALRDGATLPPPEGLSLQCLALLAAASMDADLFRAWLEYVGTLTPIQEILRRPGVVEKLGADQNVAGRGTSAALSPFSSPSPSPSRSSSPSPTPPGPDRAQLLTLVG
jgi:2-polyprenyl-6-methoxyphenol hydroxylase-like FAD-dependent oxidoreductase